MADNPRHIKDLVPDPDNRRQHTPRNVGMIVDALHAVGSGRSIVIDEDNVVLAGNATIEAAGEAGLTDLKVVDATGSEIIAVRRSGLSDEQKRDLSLYDNRSSELAEWDIDQLVKDVNDGLDLSSFFREDELDELVQTDIPEAGLTDTDAIPEDRATDIQRGDLFELGDHRLLCGDSTKAEDVARVMDGEKAECVLTDPPYGMDLDTDWSDAVGLLTSKIRQHQTRGKKYDRVVGDDKPFDPAHIFELFTCKEMFLWGADYYAERIPDRRNGSWLVWDKRKESQAEAIGSEFELCWSRAKHKRRMLRHDWFGFLSSENGADARNRVHPTQKPVSLMVDILQQWGGEGVVADVYCGSGTTLIAAEQLGRKCYAVEIEPRFCQVTIDRWEAFTGKTATKEG